jgi:hypothetical protein
MVIVDEDIEPARARRPTDAGAGTGDEHGISTQPSAHD